MDKKSVLKLVGITVTLVALSAGYVYFEEQSQIASGKTKADSIVQRLEEADLDGIKTDLANFVGTPDPGTDEDYRQALISLDYVNSYVREGVVLEYVEGQLGTANDYTVFSAVYKLPAPQGGEDFFVVLLRNQDGEWRLTNTQLAAVNPLDD